MAVENEFKVGQKVKCNASHSKVISDKQDVGWSGIYQAFLNGEVLVVKQITSHFNEAVLRWPSENDIGTCIVDINMLVNADNEIARPILEERKVGKVQMDLFDSGFPNAIMEVAKVMTWAGEFKGYKPHDWKNLPNAATEFSAAASRHRVKGFIQKSQGVPAIERTDDESNIVHLAHTCFNCLAELELVLTGKIK